MNERRPSAARFRPRPKAELHLHLEGCVGPALLRRLLDRNHHAVPAAETEAVYRFRDFDGFLAGYARICRWLHRADDWRQVVVDLGRRLRREGVLHAEVFFAASVHTRNGIPYAELVQALAEGAARVREQGGPSLLFMADGVRQWGPDDLCRMVDDVLRWRSPLVAAVGMGGDERAFPARDFTRGLARARDAGLALVVHGGEVGSPDALRDVVRSLAPARIAHGVAAVLEPHLLDEIRAAGVTLDVCLTSNLRTGAVGGRQALLALLAAEIRTTLGTDDPALFRCTLSGEFARAAALGVPDHRLRALARQAGRSSLLPEAEKQALIRRIDAGWPGGRGSGSSSP